MPDVAGISARLRAFLDAHPHDFRRPSLTFLRDVDPRLQAEFDALGYDDQEAALGGAHQMGAAERGLGGSR